MTPVVWPGLSRQRGVTARVTIRAETSRRTACRSRRAAGRRALTGGRVGHGNGTDACRARPREPPTASPTNAVAVPVLYRSACRPSVPSASRRLQGECRWPDPFHGRRCGQPAAVVWGECRGQLGRAAPAARGSCENLLLAVG